MYNLLRWIKKHKTKVIIILVGLFCCPLVSIHLLFKLTAPFEWLSAEWDAGDLLGYCGTFLAFIGTMFLGYIAILQSKQANDMNKDLLELEWRRQQPCFNIVNYQNYKIFLDEEINNYKSQINLANELYIEPLFIAEPRTGIETSVALIEMEVTNSGNSDIRQIYIQDMDFFLGLHAPTMKQRPICLNGNHLIKQGETRRFIIDFHQELIDGDDDISTQLEWILKDKKLLMPRLKFLLHIISTDGFEYNETLSLDSGWNAAQSNEGLILERTMTTSDVNIARKNGSAR